MLTPTEIISKVKNHDFNSNFELFINDKRLLITTLEWALCKHKNKFIEGKIKHVLS